MLILPIKKQWYDMILAGKKTEEYREIKPYYTKRFLSSHLLKETLDKDDEEINMVPDRPVMIRFRNGYSENSPSFRAICSLSIGTGKIEWGAEPLKHYYVLHILSIE